MVFLPALAEGAGQFWRFEPVLGCRGCRGRRVAVSFGLALTLRDDDTLGFASALGAAVETPGTIVESEEVE